MFLMNSNKSKGQLDTNFQSQTLDKTWRAYISTFPLMSSDLDIDTYAREELLTWCLISHWMNHLSVWVLPSSYLLFDNAMGVVDQLNLMPFPWAIAYTPLAQPMSGDHLTVAPWPTVTCLPVPQFLQPNEMSVKMCLEIGRSRKGAVTWLHSIGMVDVFIDYP